MKKNKEKNNRKEGNVNNTSIIKKLNTGVKPTWCPGCFNFQILAGIKNFVKEEIENSSGKLTKNDFAIVSGIGCHAKIYDYLDLNGINSIHGRVPPTCIGIKKAKPDVNVIGFAGDGDAYAEGISHTIHAARYNEDFTFVVHNNQIFALTVGQPTPTSESGFVDSTNPKGNENFPLNSIRLMLSSGAGFVARVFADSNQVSDILKKAKKHKGFAFVEILQPCIIFHSDKGYKEHFYSLQEEKIKHDASDWNEAMKRANEFNYNGIKEKTKIPLGIFYDSSK